MEIKITKKKIENVSTRSSLLLKTLRNLKDDEMAQYKANKIEVHNDRSLLTRLGKRHKLGFGTKYDAKNEILYIWKAEFVEKKKGKAKKQEVVDIDPKIKNLKPGDSFVISKTNTRGADVRRVRKHARSAGIKINTYQHKNGVDVVVERPR